MSTSLNFALRNIYEHLTESALTYRVLAEKARGVSLKSIFEKMRVSRGPMSSTLAHEAAMDGEKIPLSGTIGGVVDRIWLRIRDSLAHPDAHVVIEECERADLRLLEHYDEALAIEELPAHVKAVLAQQRALIVGDIEILHRAGASEHHY